MLGINITGYFDLTIQELNTEIEVSKEVEIEVFQKLQSGHLFLNMSGRIIVGEDLVTPLYTVFIEATESSEYEFEQVFDEEDVHTLQEYANRLGYTKELHKNSARALETIQIWAEENLDESLWDYPLSEKDEVKADEFWKILIGSEYRLCELP